MKPPKNPETAPAAEFVPTHGGVYSVEAGQVTTLEGGPPGVALEPAALDVAAPVTNTTTTTKDGAA